VPYLGRKPQPRPKKPRLLKPRRPKKSIGRKYLSPKKVKIILTRHTKLPVKGPLVSSVESVLAPLKLKRLKEEKRLSLLAERKARRASEKLESRKLRLENRAKARLLVKQRRLSSRALHVPKPKLGLKKVKKIRTPKKSTKVFAVRLRKPHLVKKVKGPSSVYKRHRESSESWNEGHPVVPMWADTRHGTVPHAYSSQECFRYPTKLSIMDDVVNNKGKYNPISHVIFESHLAKIPDADDVGYYINLQDYSWYVKNLHNKDFLAWPWLPGISAATLSEYSISAFNKFHDQVPTTVSVANFLYELKDMKGMIPKIEKSFSKTVSNNFLGFSFGTAPFVDDIQKMIHMSDEVDKRLKHLISVNGRTTDLTFKRETLYEEPFYFQRSLSDGLSLTVNQEIGGDRIEFKRQSARTTVQIGGKLTQDLRDLADANAKLKALIASSGFNHPARVVWNAIPYSFVIDWLFSAGKLLDGISIQPFGGTYRVTDVGYSIKSEATYIATYIATYPAQVVGNPTLGTVRIKRYDRFEGFPASSLFLTDLMLTPKQQVLATAMLEQRRR